MLTVLYGKYDTDFMPRLSLTIAFCGIVVATTCYLSAEFALRPVAAQALAIGPPPRRLAPGIMGRTLTVWTLCSGMPMIGIGLIGEYVGRTYQVVRARQRYHVKEVLETK